MSGKVTGRGWRGNENSFFLMIRETKACLYGPVEAEIDVCGKGDNSRSGSLQRQKEMKQM